MKPYKNPRKYVWDCPLRGCETTLHSGGLGHIKAQVFAHLKHVHGLFEEPKHNLLNQGFIKTNDRNSGLRKAVE